ncbi:MAG: SH3 domain-containing protein [Microcystaceae cyanobacterium]
MKRFSGVFQFIIGFFLGLTIFVGGLSLLGYFVFSRLAATPPRPAFPEENKTKTVKQPGTKALKPTPQASSASGKKEDSKTETKPKVEPSPAVSPTPEASPSATPEPTPTPEAKKEELPAGAYRAKVIRSEGLSLRGDPSKEAERVGGVGYNADLVVLEKSPDGEWVKVKTAEGGQEGWVRAGNLKKEE